MKLPTSLAVAGLIPTQRVLARGLYYTGDGEAILTLIPMMRLPPIPLDPQAADGANDPLTPKGTLLLRYLIESRCETSESPADADGNDAGSHLPTRPPVQRGEC
jgi:hypothetical protein